MMNSHRINRRSFLRSAALAASAPLLGHAGGLFAEELISKPSSISSDLNSAAKVALVSRKSYGPEVRDAFRKGFDMLGGIGSLVKDKTVTVKINLTGTNFSEHLGHSPGETYMTHYDTAAALASSFFDAGAKRVRFVESTNSRAPLETTLDFAGWDLKALQSLGKVEFENTRNLGLSKDYAHLKVGGGGRMFSSFDLNRSYADTDVFVSLAKMKQHMTAGVTLTMKNLFGITPNSLYGEEAGNENATAGRGNLHSPRRGQNDNPPGLKGDVPQSSDSTVRVPRIITDICAARPIHLAIIDGISTMTGGEGPWYQRISPQHFVRPGVLIMGLNPVSTDAVGIAMMGYADPRAMRGQPPFAGCDNHILLAEQAGLGTAELARIDLRGLSIDKARFSFDSAGKQTTGI